MSSSTKAPEHLSRRRIMQSIGAAAATAPALGLLGGCALGGGDEDTGTPNDNSSEGTPENPFAVVADSTLEVLGFAGGLGDAPYTKVLNPLMQRAFPDLTINYSSTESQSQVLPPKFIGGNPPDFIDNSGANAVDVNALVSEGQLLDLSPLFAAPSVDDPDKTVRETLVGGVEEGGSYNGKPYVLAYTTGPQALWYDKNLFTAKGWTMPADWAGFLALLEKIKKAGITPFGFPGANAPDYCTTVILSSAIKAGGHDLIRNIDNLVDGAWRVDAMRDALAAWQEVGAKYVDRSNEGLKHTEVQLLQVTGKLGFYPCGSWIEGEMKDDTPGTFEFAMLPTPSLSSADKLSGAGVRATPSGSYMIAAKGDNTDAALEYMRQMVSKEGAQQFTQQTSQLTTVIGGAGAELTPGIKSAADGLTAAGQDTFTWKFMGWYKPMGTAIKEATNGLMFGRLTPDQFIDSMQKVADEVKADSSIAKFQRQ